MKEEFVGHNTCALCGDTPAEQIKLQSASSRIIWWNHQKIDKPLCAGCAEVAYYQLQTRTLIQGWWGPISAAATIFFSLANMVRINAHRNSLTHVKGEKEMLIRPRLNARSNPAAVVMSVVALLIIGSIASSYLSRPMPLDENVPSSYSGSCWSEESGSNQLLRVNCSDSNAVYEVSFVTSNYNECSDLYISAGNQYACLVRRY